MMSEMGKALMLMGGFSWCWEESSWPWGNGHTLMADGDGLAGCQAILLLNGIM